MTNIHLKYLKYKSKYLNLIKTYQSKSKIHGEGIFTHKNIIKNEKIEIGIDYILNLIPWITKTGSMINHSYNPTCRLVMENNKYWIVANENLVKDTEITLNYNETPWFIQGPEANYV